MSNLKNFDIDAYENVKTPSRPLEEFSYGLEKSTWLLGDVYRFLAAGGDKETLAKNEAERISELDEKYSHLNKDSAWTTGGEIAGLVADPSAIGVTALAVPSKIAKFSNLANRGVQATATGAVATGDYTMRELAAGREIDPVTAGGILGISMLVGGLIPPGTAKASTTPEKASTVKVSTTPEKAANEITVENTPNIHIPIPEEVQNSVDSLITRFYATKGDVVDESLGLVNNSRKVEASNQIRLKYIEQKQLRKKKGPSASFSYLTPEDKMSDVDFLKLEGAYEESKAFRKDFARILTEQAENISENVEGIAGTLQVNGQLNKNTIAQVVYRPIIGSLGGLGVGASVSLYSDEEFNPIPWMLAGTAAGAASKWLSRSGLDEDVIESGQQTANQFLRNSLQTQLKVFFSGSSAAKGNAFGGEVDTLSKSLFSQRGASLRGAASVSVEESQNLVFQTFSKQFTDAVSDSGINTIKNSKTREELFRASFMQANGFWDNAYLSSKYTPEQVNIINKISEASLGIVDGMTDRAKDSGIKFKSLFDYGLPQMHNASEVAKDVDKALEVYREAYIKQKLSESKTGKINIEVAENFIRKWVAGLAHTGVPGYVPKSAFSPLKEGKKQLDELYSPMRPLSDHFEKDRLFTDPEARKLLAENNYLETNVSKLIPRYLNNTIKITEFAKRFGPKGEGVQSLKRSIKDKYETLRLSATGNQLKGLNSREKQELSTVNDMVNGYFGLIDAGSAAANNSLASAATSLFVTAANIAYLPKATITSLGELAQPLINNESLVGSLKGYARALSKEKDFGRKTGFSEMSSLENEMRQYALEIANPDSGFQTGLRKTNEWFFKTIQLPRFTDFSRRYAYNAGIEDTFNVAKKISRKRTTALQNKANSLGLSDEYIEQLNKFKTVDEAFESSEGRKILNIGGLKSADRDAIIPTIGNRRAFTQSRDPFMRAFGQFLSWAQAKTTQTNALITRMEDGDHKLFAKALGTLVLYNGVVTFKDFLNDPTGEWLDENKDNYLENYLTLETLGRGVQHSGNFNHYLIEKLSRFISSDGNNTPIEDAVPAFGLVGDLYKDFVQLSKNISYGDYPGAVKQAMDTAVPFGTEIQDISEGLGIYDFEDRPNIPIKIHFRKGGIVEDVPKTSKEPDERVDKMTGVPYDQQAGEAFVDAEEYERRLGFLGGGITEGGKVLKALKRRQNV